MGSADQLTCRLPTAHCRPFLGQPVARQRVVQRLVQVQLADRVAELVGLGPLNALAALAGGDLLVPLALALPQVREDLHQGTPLHAGDGPRRQAEFALAVLVEQALLDELLEQLGLGLVLRVLQHLFDRLQGLVAVLHDEVHELVEPEQLVLRGELLPVELAVEVLHEAPL